MPPTIDRQSTPPFHLKLFYRLNNYHHLSDFAPQSSSSSFNSNYNGPISGPNAIRARSPLPPPSTTTTGSTLPSHLQIYTWQSCTLRELSQLLTSALPSLLPDPPVGTRLCFRLIYPDTKGAAMMGPDARGRYLAKELGSVVVGPRGSSFEGEEEEKEAGGKGVRIQGHDAERTLQEARFVIGDYVDCAVLPPLEDGSVAPPVNAGRGMAMGGGMRAFPGMGPGGGGGRGERIPPGDWRRGERLPEGSLGERNGGGGGGGGGRGGGGDGRRIR
ncbi:hypothetical protein BO94DRAFT_562921 [Aspergillus sclerotioniger CBS 115572]|uniref:Sin3-associated polypeptide Sap18 n=1 Tax=Aspergillus sclerotioniger CBS 115572 TaxID=1450535 RepID=A0A317XA63_9EURO|nr:hypothetical protein BO94DRAFT_562921 [Aspergillus sclerotioniger CBS 115572]PWY95275.1 hypothetical protein BO94DRAFT_562921 [Aspergillus sclerotioniger CBS 115572]